MIEKVIKTDLMEEFTLPLDQINDPENELLIKCISLKFLKCGLVKLKQHYIPSELLLDDEISITKKLRRVLVTIESDFVVNLECTSDNEFRPGAIDLKLDVSRWKKYFTFECKKLDGSGTLSRKYIQEGLIRFCNGKYCVDFNSGVIDHERTPNFGGMIGYVVDGNIGTIESDLRKSVQTTKFNENGIDFGHISADCGKLLFEKVQYFEYSFKSKHHRIIFSNSSHADLEDILLYHIFFDLT